ncbi:transcription termination/antitermination protein NusG [Mesorhizobium sp.]|uniref:transcription termination/antitermination protein NusG n=1 Tax=Mesorhizobium sp. TaxID=1871066 RepID=UPI0025C2BCE7|nr:transcription termination/antitermination protein NusG [Mesorhizobium sp.]
MMRADVKRLNEREHVFVDRSTGEIINVDRAWQKSDKRIKVRRRDQALLAAAGMDGPEAHWYVLRVEDRTDIAVDKSLEEANVERVMLHTEVEAKRRGRRKYQSLEPVRIPSFPGYIFVKVVSCPVTWAGLRTIEGVLGPIGGCDNPSPVKEQEILKFQARIEKDPEAIRLLTNALKAGDKVAIDSGPFAGFEAVVLMLNDKHRVSVEVDIFGRKTAIGFDLADVTKLD